MSYPSRIFTNSRYRDSGSRPGLGYLGVNGSGSSNGKMKFQLGKSIDASFQRANGVSSVPSAAGQAVSAVTNSLLDYDDARVQQSVNEHTTEMNNYISNTLAGYRTGTDSMRNSAVTSARHPWQVTDANSDWAARSVAIDKSESQMQQAFREWQTNNSNMLSSRRAAQDLWGGILGPLGRLGAAVYQDFKDTDTSGELREKITKMGIEPSTVMGNHVKLYGQQLPDEDIPMQTFNSNTIPETQQTQETSFSHPSGEEAETSV